MLGSNGMGNNMGLIFSCLHLDLESRMKILYMVYHNILTFKSQAARNIKKR